MPSRPSIMAMFNNAAVASLSELPSALGRQDIAFSGSALSGVVTLYEIRAVHRLHYHKCEAIAKHLVLQLSSSADDADQVVTTPPQQQQQQQVEQTLDIGDEQVAQWLADEALTFGALLVFIKFFWFLEYSITPLYELCC
jgi:hypothetical protein